MVMMSAMMSTTKTAFVTVLRVQRASLTELLAWEFETGKTRASLSVKSVSRLPC